MLRVLVLVCAAASLARASEVFDTHWRAFLPQVDTDENNLLSAREMTGMMSKLGIDPATQIYRVCTTQPCTFDILVNTYDADGDGELDANEVANMISGEQRVGMAILDAFAMAPDPDAAGALMNSAMNPSPALVAAAAKIAKSFNVRGKLFAGDRTRIINSFASIFGVPESQIILTITRIEEALAAGSSRMSRRKLQVEQPEYTVTVTALVADQAAADTAGAAADTALADPASSSVALGVTVTTVEPAASIPVAGMKEMPTMSFALIIFAVLFPLMTCIGGCMTSSASRKKKSAASEGCTKNGCCSNDAIISWSGMLLLVSIVLLIACFMLYGQMSAFISAIKSIISTLLVAQSGSGQMASMAAALPTDIIDMVSAQLDLLGIAVIIPGVVSAVLLIIIAICGFAKKKGGFCGAKCLIMLSYIFLLLSFITYIACMAMAVVMFVPTAQAMLRQYLVICDTTVPMLTQMLADVQGTLDEMTAAGVAPTAEMQTQVDEASATATLMRGLCDGIFAMIAAIEGLLGPSVLAFSMVIAAFWTDFGTCCAMGCCKSPHSAKTAPA